MTPRSSCAADSPLPREVRVCWNGPLPEPQIRSDVDLIDVMARPCTITCTPAYYMYRDVAMNTGDRRWLADHALRYDITVIPPREMCGEFIKTAGHYHPKNRQGAGYPEVYEVLAGQAHYLLQSRDLADAILVLAEAGDVVIVPPGYGHVTINPAEGEILQMANIVSSAFESEYAQYRERRGAAYYEMTDGTFVPNPAYRHVPELRTFSARDVMKKAGSFASPLYRLIGERSGILDCLNNPEQYMELFSGLYT